MYITFGVSIATIYKYLDHTFVIVSPRSASVEHGVCNFVDKMKDEQVLFIEECPTSVFSLGAGAGAGWRHSSYSPLQLPAANKLVSTTENLESPC